MKAGMKHAKLVFIMVLFIIAAALLVLISGCSNIPTFKYCDHVEYIRNGAEITVSAHCNAPIGGSI